MADGSSEILHVNRLKRAYDQIRSDELVTPVKTKVGRLDRNGRGFLGTWVRELGRNGRGFLGKLWKQN
jgi:hypothetical protein